MMEKKLQVTVSLAQAFNFEGAIRGMRNPLESWNRIDSKFNPLEIGKNDYDLMKRLCLAGKEHRKFLRQICVSCDIIAPLYWWREYETYQIGTTENSTSQMHKLGKRLLNRDDFCIDVWRDGDNTMLDIVNARITAWQTSQKPDDWRSMLQIIPQSYIYKRTCSLNYEVLANQHNQRQNHKLIEWHQYLDQMKTQLPYPELFTMKFQ